MNVGPNRLPTTGGLRGGRRPVSRLSAFALEPRVLFSGDPGIGIALVIDDAGAGPARHASPVAFDVAPAPVTTRAPAQPESVRFGVVIDEHAFATDSNARTFSTQLIVIDPQVADHEALADGVRRADGDPAIDVLVLDPQRDAFEQIGERLAQRDAQGRTSTVHLITHGSDGAIRLGAQRLDFDSLASHATEISGWRASLEGADLLIYGCDVAATTDGRALVDALARLTGADVAASTDTTGGAAQGGDWELEYKTGPVATDATALTITLADWNGQLAPTVINVTTTADTLDGDTSGSIANLLANLGPDGQISLREAVIAAQHESGDVTIALATGATYSLTIQGANEDLAATGDLDINSSVEITAAGSATIYNSGDRVFDVNGATASLTLRNINLRSDVVGDGGAVRIFEGQLALHASRISNSSASGSGGAIHASGGATNAPIVTIDESSQLENNVAGADGGAIAITGGGTHEASLTINASTIDGNIANGDGGGIQAIQTALTISGQSVLVGNLAFNTDAINGRGGAVFVSGIAAPAFGWIEIIDSTIDGNHADRDGGGLYLETPNIASITGSRLTSNQSDHNGGAVRTDMPGGSLTIERSLFGSNQATDATNLGRGGALYVGAGSASLINVTLYGNSAYAAAAIDSPGNDASAHIVLDHITSDGNTASYAGAYAGGTFGRFQASNTIFNDATSVQSGLPIATLGHNIYRGTWPSSLDLTDVFLTTTTLAPLDLANGVWWMVPAAGSAAIDNADPLSSVAVDQRNVARDATPWIGAYETGSGLEPPVLGIPLASTNYVIPDPPIRPFDLLTLNDPDSAIGSGSLTISGYVPGSDVASFTVATANIIVVGPDAGGAFVLTGSATPAEWQTLLRGFSFESTNPLADGTRTLTLSVQDTTSGQASLSYTINIFASAVGFLFPPEITSNGGGATATIAVPEGSTGVTIATATDQDTPPSQLNYELLAGIDANEFAIDPLTRRISFRTPPDYEGTAEAARSRHWEIDLRVSDPEGGNAIQTLSIDVTDVPPQPQVSGMLTAPLGTTRTIDNSLLASAEPGLAATQVQYRIVATPNGGDLLLDTTMLGVNAGFTQDAIDSGKLAFRSNGGYTGPATFLYSLSTVGGPVSIVDHAFAISNVVNQSPFIDRLLPIDAVRDALVTIDAMHLHADDIDSTPAEIAFTIAQLPAAGTVERDGATLAYGAQFTQAEIDDGRIGYRHGGGVATIDQLGLMVGNAGQPGTFAQGLTILIPSTTTPIVITSAPGLVTPENKAISFTAVASGGDPGSLLPLSFSLSGGADRDRFTIDPWSGVLHWAGLPQLPDHEAPIDADQNNVYELTIRAQDASGSGEQKLVITVADVDDTAPSSGGARYAAVVAGNEIVLNAKILQAIDPDTTPENLVYTLEGLPKQGELLRRGDSLATGAQFTQAEIDAGLISYRAAIDGDGPVEIALTLNDPPGAGDGAISVLTITVSPPSGGGESPPLIAPRDPPPKSPPPAPPPGPTPVDVPPATRDGPTPDIVVLPVAMLPMPTAAPSEPKHGPGARSQPSSEVSQGSGGDESGIATRDGRIAVDREPTMADSGGASWLRSAPMPDDPPATGDAPAVAPAAMLADEAWLDALDRTRKANEATPVSHTITVGASSALVGGASVGYVLWLLRGGVLLSGMLSSLPAWTTFDPIPVLGNAQQGDAVLAARRKRRERAAAAKAGSTVHAEHPENADSGDHIERLFDARAASTTQGDAARRRTS